MKIGVNKVKKAAILSTVLACGLWSNSVFAATQVLDSPITGGNFKYTEDTLIEYTNAKGAVNLKDDATFDASGHILTFSDKAPDKTKEVSTAYPITVICGSGHKSLTITADKLVLSSDTRKRDRTELIDLRGDWDATAHKQVGTVSMTVNGDLDLTCRDVYNKNNAAVYVQTGSDFTVNGNVTCYDENGWALDNKCGGFENYGSEVLYATSAMRDSLGGHLKVTGDVKMKINGNGLFANAGGAVLNVLGGGYIELENDKENRFNKTNYYAINAMGGTVTFNMLLDEKGKAYKPNNRKVVIKGNIGATTGAVNGADNDAAKLTEMHVALITPDSSLEGICYNSFPEEGIDSPSWMDPTVSKLFKGETNMWLQNGASWYNKPWCKKLNNFWGGIKYEGSTVDYFHGGDSLKNAGSIYQQEVNDIHLRNYEGNTVFLYEHEEDAPTKMGVWATKWIYEKDKDGKPLLDSKGRPIRHKEKYIKEYGGVEIRTPQINSNICVLTDRKGFSTESKKSTLMTAEQRTKAEEALAFMADKLHVINDGNNIKAHALINDSLDKDASNFAYSTIKFDGEGKGTLDKMFDIVYMKDGKNIEVDKFSGNVIAFYEHKAEVPSDIIGGDFVIKSAESGSTIRMITDRTGIKDESSAIDVLSVLAGKLYYSAYVEKDGVPGERNLEGSVAIAEGLTAISEVLELGGIKFDVNGRGVLHVYPKKQVEDEVSIGIDNEKTENKEVYKEAGILKDGDYIFTLDPSKITTKGNDVAVLAENSDVNIKSEDAKLFIDAENTALQIRNGNQITMHGKKFFIQGKTAIDIADDNSTLSVENALIKGDVKLHNGGLNLKSSALEAPEFVATGSSIVMLDESKLFANVKSEKIKEIALHNNSLWKGNLEENEDIPKVKYSIKSASEASEKNIIDIDKTSLWEGASLKKDVKLNLHGCWKQTSGDSEISEFYAGKESVLDKTDSDTGNLVIDDYSGNLTVIYGRDNKNKEQVNGGNIKVNKASKGSTIKLLTSPVAGTVLVPKNYIDKEVYFGIINNLAYKMIATEDAAKEMSVTAGYTESLVATENTMRFNAVRREDGHYEIVEPEIVYGPKETAMIRGAKNAMTNSMLNWRDSLSSMNERVGDLRHGGSGGVWSRIYSGKSEYDNGRETFKNEYKGVQIGLDKKADDKWYLGAAFNYNDGNAKYENLGTGDPKLYMLTLYGTKIYDCGQYMDFTFKAGRVEDSYTVKNIYGNSLEADYKSTGYGVGIEYGKRFGNEKRYFEPNLKVTLGHLDGVDYDAESNFEGGKTMHVSQSALKSVVGRLGLSSGIVSEKGKMYLDLGIAHEFNGTTESAFSAENEPDYATECNFKDTWCELALGGTYNMSEHSYLYGDFSKSFGGDYKNDWKINAGLRFSFR